ncbi:MAG TPA: hypothetical protein VKE41_12190, partial [Roseiflexaceae bacterium]|nr:hypothetical protein [Roseiflexaceae bacterium]
MYLRTIAARIASTTLLGTLAFVAAGAGTAAAASSIGQHASIHIVAIPAATAQVGPGGSFTDTFVISDPNNEGAHDVSLLTTYPAAVQLHGVQFSRGGAWVDSTTGNSFVARLGDIGRDG